jgi:hypothetical protein
LFGMVGQVHRCALAARLRGMFLPVRLPPVTSAILGLSCGK